MFLTIPAFAMSEEELSYLRMYFKDEELQVVSSTRGLKPINRVAENMTVISAKEIEDMNAHSVAEVLNRVTGIFVDSSMEFSSFSFAHIQGSADGQDRHVLVLLDGMSFNNLSGGHAETIMIPVRIIESIEIIKGPASSVWGSSLGGVINIITKNAEGSKGLTGTLSASYGEKNSQDYSAEASGKSNAIGFYIYAGRQESDGLRNNRFSQNNSLFAKLGVALSNNVTIGLSSGYSEPHLYTGLISSPIGDISTKQFFRDYFATVSLNAKLGQELDFALSLNMHQQKFAQPNYFTSGDLFKENIFDEKTVACSAKLEWTHGPHMLVVGTDVSHGDLKQNSNYGPLYQSFGAPASTFINPDITKWAVFANDTIRIGSLSLTTGIRYDDNDVGGSFISPSIGATYKLWKRTIVRATIARGFSDPGLSDIVGGGLFYKPNPSLKREDVWSYQGGIETKLTDYLWLKASAFKHDMKNAQTDVTITDPYYLKMTVNKGKVKRTGYEIEAETAPVWNLSLKTGLFSVRIDPLSDGPPRDLYAYNIGLKYEDRKSFMAQLFGYYVWWNMPSDQRADYNSMVWDFNLSKKILSSDMITTEVFAAVHNIFNASYYNIYAYPNPGRWAEAGVRVKF